MPHLLQDVKVHDQGKIVRRDLVLAGGRLFFKGEDESPKGLVRLSGRDLHLFPGFTDVHVHLREPGFSYKETIRSGTAAAARGGFTTVITMPNLNPVPDSVGHLKAQLELIKEQALVRVLPLGAITTGQKGETLSDFPGMAPLVAGFSDDGRGVQQNRVMEEAMSACRELGQIIVAHCEDESLSRGGWIHDGEYAKAHGHTGNPSQSEWKQVERDLELARRTGCRYHICHVSTKESVELVRQAKAQGVDVTCETTPHYLALDDRDLQEHGRFKMNPPIRAREDREALVAGLKDGTIDMVATDHAPHSAEEKARGLRDSLNGVVGLETAFPVLYTALVKPGLLPLGTLLMALTQKPNARFHIQPENDWTLFDLGAEYTVDSRDFLSMGKASPFEGMRVFGRCLLTVFGGQAAYQDTAFFREETV